MFWLITGGAGFIGSHLAEALLARGDRVRVLDNLSSGKRDNLPHGVELLTADVAEPKAVESALQGVDGCFHLAAVASAQRCNEEWLACHRTNLTGTIAVLNAARAQAQRPALPVIYASSAAIYGNNADLPLSENALPAPISAYGADKLGSEAQARVAAYLHGIPAVGLRLFNVYGPRQDPQSPYSGVIAHFAHLVKLAQPLTIDGDGGQSRDFIHVSDVVRHFLAAMQMAKPHAPSVINVCTGISTSIEQLARLLIELAGSKSSLAFGREREGDIRASLGNPAQALELLKIRAQVPLAQGLAELLRQPINTHAS